MAEYEYGTLFFDEDFWKLLFYDWKKKETKFEGEWKDAILALNELAEMEEWEPICAYFLSPVEKNGLPVQEYLLRRKRRQ